MSPLRLRGLLSFTQPRGNAAHRPRLLTQLFSLFTTFSCVCKSQKQPNEHHTQDFLAVPTKELCTGNRFEAGGFFFFNLYLTGIFYLSELRCPEIYTCAGFQRRAACSLSSVSQYLCEGDANTPSLSRGPSTRSLTSSGSWSRSGYMRVRASPSALAPGPSLFTAAHPNTSVGLGDAAGDETLLGTSPRPQAPAATE